MQAFRSHHQHFGDELIKAVIDQHIGDFITNFGDGLIPCQCKHHATTVRCFHFQYRTFTIFRLYVGHLNSEVL